MNKNREELLQKLIDKMDQVMKAMRSSHSSGHKFPFGDLNISAQQAFLLFYIARSKEPASAKDLAERMHVTSGAVTQFIDVLVEKDLVKRMEDPNDRRVQRIYLSDFAKSKFDMFRKEYFNSMKEAFGDLTDKEIIQLTELIGKIRKQ